MAVIPELLRYLTISFFRFGLPQKTRKTSQHVAPQVYVSLTTLPSRIGKIRATIYSLLDQSISPTKIIINVPETSKEGIPYQLPKFLKNHQRLDIRPLKKDLGPASKLLPTLKDSAIPSNALIVVVDDDQVYPKTLIETYLFFSKTLSAHALTLCGWRIPADLKHDKRNVLRASGLKILAPYANVKEPKQVEVIQGASSYAVRKSFFDDAVFNYENAPEGAFFADDIWISGHLARRKISRTVINPDFSYCRFEAFSYLRTKGLRDTANADNRNNDRLYQYFKKDWVLFD